MAQSSLKSSDAPCDQEHVGELRVREEKRTFGVVWFVFKIGSHVTQAGREFAL